MHITKCILILALIIPILIKSAPGDVSLPVCSADVHASYHATGPNGTSYPTWHPQIDPSGCHFDHEHGSDPDLFQPNYRPVYGYSASAMGMSEGNAGFKSYAFRAGGYTWLITQHMGTAHADVAACVRMHTLDIAALSSSGVLVADVHLMADFGASVRNSDDAVLTPPGCPTQGSADGTGVRKFPTMPDNIGYEPWRVDSRALPFFSSGGMTFNAPDAQTACNTISCTLSVARGELGAYRFLTINNAAGGFRIHATTAYSGTFTYAGAAQYLAPGLDISLPIAVCVPYDAAAYWYDCSEAAHDESIFRLNPLVTGAN